MSLVIVKNNKAVNKSDQDNSNNTFSIFDGKVAKYKWKKLIGSAKIYWKRLSIQELTLTNGDKDGLIKLLKDRYSIQQKEAERQVEEFFSQNK